MSFVQSLAPFLPGISKGIHSVAAGFLQNETAKDSAARLRSIGKTEGQLRRIQGAKLLGKIQASFGGRGVAGGEGTAADLEREAALFEGVDAARAEFRFTSLADQVERRGEAARATGLVGGLSGLLDIKRNVELDQRISNIRETATKLEEASRVKTVVNPHPLTRTVTDSGAFNPFRFQPRSLV